MTKSLSPSGVFLCLTKAKPADTAKWIYLGTSKELVGAEVFAILWAANLPDKRGEEGQTYTIFSDSQAAAARIQHDRCGPDQSLARAVTDTVQAPHRRGNRVTVRWTPAHAGVEGNEHADFTAKRAAEGREDMAELSPITWGRPVCPTSRERPPRPGPRLPGSGSGTTSGASAGTAPLPEGAMHGPRQGQEGVDRSTLLVHAATGEYLTRIDQAQSSDCLWCGSGERQTRHRLFIRCRRWTPEIRRLGQRAEDCEWKSPRAPSVRLLFRDERAIPMRTRGLGRCQARPSCGWTRIVWRRLSCGQEPGRRAAMSRRALRARNVGQAHLRMCVYLFYLLSRCIRPEGPWQRFAAALSDSSCFSPPLHNLILAGCCGPEEAFHSEELQGAEGARAYTNFLPLLLHLLLSLPPLPSSSSSSLCYCPRVAAGGEPGWPWTTARRPHWGPHGGDPAREAAPEAGPGSPAPRPARPQSPKSH